MAFLQARPKAPTPQTVRLDKRQHRNAAGGYVYSVDDWARLDRFLTIGTMGGSYYATETKLTEDNLAVVEGLIAEDGVRVVATVVAISQAGRALKQDYGIVTLAMALSAGGLTFEQNAPATRHAAYLAIPKVCRTASTLFQLLSYLKGRRGWSRGLRTAIASWYNDKPVDALAYQMVKYRNRHEFTHKDALRLSHAYAGIEENEGSVGPWRNNLYRWAVGKPVQGALPAIVNQFEAAKRVEVVSGDPASFRAEFARALPREALPTEWLNDPNVWEALLFGEDGRGMPLTALIRNLGNLSKCGLLTSGSDAERYVVGELMNQTRIHSARVHPLALFIASKVYGQGHSERGKGSWAPVGTVQDALMHAFELAMPNVEPTGKKLLIALDSSGSMHGATVMGIPGTTAVELCAAMSIIHLRTERDVAFATFDTSIKPLKLAADTTLERLRTRLPTSGGGTDCSLPFVAATQDRTVEGIVVYTDGETWYGHHVTQAMSAWRKHQPQGRAAFAATTATSTSLSDPNDRLSLSVAGFDANAPAVIAGFLAGRL